jgi:hypothetical protein
MACSVSAQIALSSFFLFGVQSVKLSGHSFWRSPAIIWTMSDQDVHHVTSYFGRRHVKSLQGPVSQFVLAKYQIKDDKAGR